MVAETFDRSLWFRVSPPGVSTPSLSGEATADVLVVGAGFLGLSTALHLAERGARVLLLEAAEVGFGASGRNTGFVVPSLRVGSSPEELDAWLGSGWGERLLALVAGSGRGLFDLVARLAIDCAAEQTGWLQPAHSPAMARRLELRVAERRQRGNAVEMLDVTETARRVGAEGYHGALLDRTGGQINPLAYARGLAGAAMRAGAVLHERTPVTALAREGGRWRATTPSGTAQAERVVLTTNALTGPLMPDFARSLLPTRVYQVATQPLSAELRARIAPDRTPIADTRRHTFAVRWSPDGRLVTGGLVTPGPGALGRAAATFLRRLRRFFPLLGRLDAEFVWSGVIAATRDALPRFVSLGPGLDGAIGCNGRGVALTTALGREIAALYAGDSSERDAFPLRHQPPDPIPWQPLVAFAPTLWLPWSALRDRLEGGR